MECWVTYVSFYGICLHHSTFTRFYSKWYELPMTAPGIYHFINILAFLSTNLMEDIWVINQLTSVILTWMKTEWPGKTRFFCLILQLSVHGFLYQSMTTGILLIQLKTIRKFNGYFVYYLFIFFSSLIQGGRHVDYVVDQVVGKLIEVVKKKNKAGVSVKPFQASNFMQKYWKKWMWEFCWVNWFLCFKQVKNHIWVFVNCLIENPSFDSQTKENMTLQPKSFGSKCQLSEKFFKAVSKPLFYSFVKW